MRHRIRIPLKGGEEQDMLTRWRRLLVARAGRAKAAKRAFNRRLRRTVREEIER
jgi:hypothetical protein